MVTAMATAKATMWVMVMVTRLTGDEEGKGEGGKGNGDDNEGCARATERATATRVAGERTVTATKRAMAAMTRSGGAGGGNDPPLRTTRQ